MPASFPRWWVKCVSAVPIRPIGLPYRVPSPQEQDSLRVLQYVEKQLAHFNPARSISHQSKSRECMLEVFPGSFCSSCWFSQKAVHAL